MSETPKHHTLYLCYFGLREPLVQTQVLPYLRELIRGKENPGIRVSLLTFEPTAIDGAEAGEIRSQLAGEGIEWHQLKYHKRFSVIATVYDIFCGAFFTWNLMRRETIDVLHGRVHIPTLMAALAREFSRQKPKVLFDIRGFFPEEYTDAGRWPENGAIYRVVKRIERWLLRKSDGFVVLTEKAREVLFQGSAETGYDRGGRPIEVIPCCVDFKVRFSQNGSQTRENLRSSFGFEGRFVIVHLGALGGLYLTKEIVELAAAELSRNDKAFLLLLTQSDPAEVVGLLEKKGFASSDYLVKKVTPNEVPDYLIASDVSVSFVKSSFSTLSRSPTKIPEYLACGLPVICSAGVGDVDMLVTQYGMGSIVGGFSEVEYIKAIDTTIRIRSAAGFETESRRVAEKEFDLGTVGGLRYRRLYRRLLNGENE